MGYELEDTVEIPGTMSHRGGIIDIFPPTSDLPARLEFYGNTIDSIRLFDPESQRSSSPVSSITVSPATEQLSPYSSGDSLFEYLPGNSLIIFDESQGIKTAIDEFAARSDELRTAKLEQEEVSPSLPRPYFTGGELQNKMENRRRLELTSLGISGSGESIELNFTSSPAFGGRIPAFIDKVKESLAKKQRFIIVSHQASRLSELLEEEDIIAPLLTDIQEPPSPGSLSLLQGLLAEGWTMNADINLLTDTEIFGFTKQTRLSKKRPVPRHKLFAEITPEDFVVHVEHGIAKFTGVINMSVNSGDGEKEYLVLEYSAGDKLYVPTDQIDRVSRYVGSGENPPGLSRLGTQEWSRIKQRVKESVADIAEDLIKLYAAREVVPGFSYSPDTVWQQEVEASFPYVETPDQITVQRQIKEDMEKQKPMDRLVCGDVGYGKTEVAVRAAFKAVMDGKQVAVLVPTTVLAEQHFSTFKERFSAFPIKVEVLSRFRSPKEQKEIAGGISNGSVDICIGTHRLLQKDIAFKELGLLIIDEEQRFGVVHKEHLKQIRREVDVLTLSATPIPRTLHMSLVGVRDMSVMETPPEERLPIKTYVTEFNEHLIREAVLREIERNGQIFFVHNRVQNIVYTAEKLQAIVPEARISIGHGQMPEGELEKVMAAFFKGESDILVCSSIIQSGLDMPNVNTLIVNQSDKFGLTQLYQLRGRVGRGANLAYAYFLYDHGKRLSPIAERRLRTIVEANELGAGFSIAMKDLEIRGAGTLLGMRQSGHISAVGFNLYCQLLAQAVEEQKANQGGREIETLAPRLPTATIDLPFQAYIPEDYVVDLLTRLGLYQKLSKLENIGDIESLQHEFQDRFGMPPQEIDNLLYAIKIKILATAAAIQSISAQRGEIVINPFEGMRFEREKLDRLSREGLKTGTFEIRLNPGRLKDDWQQVLEEVIAGIT
ncbi:transcription-repair coupling factor [Chloroflexota bacterium]